MKTFTCVFAPKAPIFGSPKSHFSVRSSVRSSVCLFAATKIKTVTDETIKTCTKSTKISGVFEGMVYFKILCQFILVSKNDQFFCRFTNGKTIQKGAKNALKSSFFLCFDADMTRKTDVTLCPVTRFRS